MHGEPPAHWWIDAASGAAPRAVRGLFACCVELNPRARKTAETLDVMGAILLEESEPGTPMAMSAPDPGLVGTDVTQDGGADPLFPTPLRRLGFSRDSIPWRSRIGGIKARRIDDWCEPGVDARLFRFEADAGIPEHDHRGEEFTLVLDGGFFDQGGIYHRGDMAYARAGFRHEPRGLPDESCICVTVSLGGYRFSNPLAAFAARFLK